MNYIEPTDLKEKMDRGDGLTLVDIREPYELEICYMGGLKIPMGEVVSRISEIPEDKDLVIVCRSGKRAAALANLLYSEYQRENVHVLDGGILRWIEEVDNSLEAY